MSQEQADGDSINEKDWTTKSAKEFGPRKTRKDAKYTKKNAKPLSRFSRHFARFVFQTFLSEIEP